MKARAARLHAAHDIRIDEFELPDIKDDEMLVRVISDSMCMSTYKSPCQKCCEEGKRNGKKKQHAGGDVSSGKARRLF